jgi:glutamate 5-kinase
MENINLVKIGSDALSEENVKKVLQDMKYWQIETGEKAVLISSGAIKTGRKIV